MEQQAEAIGVSKREQQAGHADSKAAGKVVVGAVEAVGGSSRRDQQCSVVLLPPPPPGY